MAANRGCAAQTATHQKHETLFGVCKSAPSRYSLGLALQRSFHEAQPKIFRLPGASCEEIVREYRNYSAAEKEAEAQIRQSTAGTAAANVAGIAAFAVLGFGFFTWDDNSDARENLAELRDIRVAIAEGARKKGCNLQR